MICAESSGDGFWFDSSDVRNVGAYSQVIDWSIDKAVLDFLHVTDYINRGYWTPGMNRNLMGLYIAYLRSQRAGATIHSPKNCLPGAGWNPVQASIYPLPLNDGRTVPVKGTHLRMDQSHSTDGNERTQFATAGSSGRSRQERQSAGHEPTLISRWISVSRTPNQAVTTGPSHFRHRQSERWIELDITKPTRGILPTCCSVVT